MSWRIGRRGWGGGERRLTKQVIEAFEDAHLSLKLGPKDEASGALYGNESGACGVALLLRRRKMILAHVGDCRAVLGTLDENQALVHVEVCSKLSIVRPSVLSECRAFACP